MFPVHCKKLEIENMFEKEKENLTLLVDRISKSSQLTCGINKILKSFEQRLSKLEDTILPVYNDTENLRRCQHNMELTLQSLDNVISYYSVSQEVEDIIRKGPGLLTEDSCLNVFLDALNRLAKAILYFQKNNPESVEIENVTSLFNSGGDCLNREFKDLLSKHSKPMLPIVLLNIINIDEETTDDDIIQSQMPNYVKADLEQIASWLIRNNRDEFMTVYGKIRGSLLNRSMQMLKEHQRSISGGSTQGFQISHSSSPMLRTKFSSRNEASRKPSTKRLHYVFEKKANRMFMKASQTLEQSTGLFLGGRRTSTLGDAANISEEVDNEQEMENYLIYVVALHRLMQIEQSFMRKIIPNTHQPRVFELIIREAMDDIVQEGENIAARAKRCISRHDYAAILVVFPILKQLLSLKPEFEKTVEECDVTVRTKFNSILNMLHTTIAKALEDFIENLRSEAITQLPPDGTVHELTSNVLVFLEQLLDYSDTIGGVLSTDTTYNQPVVRLQKQVDMNNALLGVYIRKVLSQLNHTLFSKSENYNDNALKAIFRLNNNNYVLKSLQQSKLLEYVALSAPQCEQEFCKMIDEHKKSYFQSWSKLLSYISLPDDTSFKSGEKLRDKDRAVIKEKFAGFNKELEEIIKVQRSYSIPDVELRESVKRDNKEYILPKYNAFYEMFSNLNFTKNREKYIKFTPEQISASIDRFFDVAA